MSVLAGLHRLSKPKKQAKRKTVAEYQQEVLIRAGRDQFETLLTKKIKIPVVFL